MKDNKTQITRESIPYGIVLVVDDVETNIYIAEGLLSPYGLKIDSADSGQAAIDKIKSGNVYDIVFMDHMMPSMDGVEATCHIRALGYKAPIVALTANDVAGQADMFVENGFNDVISKPIDMHQMNAMLNKWIRDKQPPEVLEAARRLTFSDSQNAAGAGETIDAKIAEAFARDAGKSMPVLDAIMEKNGEYSNEDMRAYVIHTHGLKSALANIGKSDLSAAASKLEKAGREDKPDIIVSETPGFLRDLRAYLEQITPKKSAAAGAAVISDSDLALLKDKLLAIKAACDDYDERTADEELSKLKQKTWSVAIDTVLSAISEHLLHSDFEEAGKIAENCANTPIAAGADTSAGKVAQAEAKKISIKTLDIPGMDMQGGLDRFDGNEELFEKVLRSFANSGQKLLDAMIKPNESNIDDYMIKAHGIKGMCYDVYAIELGKEAAGLEKAANNNDVDYVNKHNPAFLEAAGKLIFEIEAALQIIEGNTQKPKKKTIDAQALSRLLDACRHYSMDGADEVMQEIDKYQYEKGSELIDWIREKIYSSEFREIAERLEREGAGLNRV